MVKALYKFFLFQNIRYFLKHFSQTALACFSQTELHDPQTLTRFSFLGCDSFGQDDLWPEWSRSLGDNPLCSCPIAPGGTCDKVTVVTAGDTGPGRLIGRWFGKFWVKVVGSDRSISPRPTDPRRTGPGTWFRYLKSAEFLFKWWNWITDWIIFRLSFWRNCSFIAINRSPQDGFNCTRPRTFWWTVICLLVSRIPRHINDMIACLISVYFWRYWWQKRIWKDCLSPC